MDRLGDVAAAEHHLAGCAPGDGLAVVLGRCRAVRQTWRVTRPLPQGEGRLVRLATRAVGVDTHDAGLLL